MKDYKHQILHFALIGLLGYLFIGLFPPKADAEGMSLKIQPSSLQIHASASADIRVPFTISNQTDTTIPLSVILKRFQASEDEDGKIVFTKPDLSDEKGKDSFLKGVQIVDDGFITDGLTLSPKQEKKLQLVINVAKNSPPQDHYFALVLLSRADEITPEQKKPKETISSVQIGISLPVLLSIGKNSDQAIFIEDFSSPVFLQSGPVPFTLKLKNAGTHFASPKAVILIKNIFGQTVGRIDIPKTNILSGSSRYLTNSNNQLPAPRSLSEVGSTQKILWPENFLLGLYTASLSVVDEDDKLLYSRNIHFTSFPFSFLASILLASIIFAIILRRIKKKLSQV